MEKDFKGLLELSMKFIASNGLLEELKKDAIKYNYEFSCNFDELLNRLEEYLYTD